MDFVILEINHALSEYEEYACFITAPQSSQKSASSPRHTAGSRP